jgi:hypothetical protein
MSDLTKKINVVSRLATLSKVVDFDNFYNISISIRNDQVSLQGYLTNENLVAAKKLDVFLEYDNNMEMLRGESEDGKLRIVLTT